MTIDTFLTFPVGIAVGLVGAVCSKVLYSWVAAKVAIFKSKLAAVEAAVKSAEASAAAVKKI